MLRAPAIAVTLTLLSACAFDPEPTSDADLVARLAVLEATVAAQQVTIEVLRENLAATQPVVDEADALLRYVSVNEDDTLGPAVTVVGANLYVQSGTGSTYGAVNGVGNVIIGYNEKSEGVTRERSGSHNLVIGTSNEWTSYAGIVSGTMNTVAAPYAAVVGGRSNSVEGESAAAVGGVENKVIAPSGDDVGSVIAGGYRNISSGRQSLVAGGTCGGGSGDFASVLGGAGDCSDLDGDDLYDAHLASGESSVVVGGWNNVAVDYWSGTFGGASNSASASYSATLGGNEGSAAYESSVVVAGNGSKTTSAYQGVVGD